LTSRYYYYYYYSLLLFSFFRVFLFSPTHRTCFIYYLLLLSLYRQKAKKY
jgi:hypothetical protein